MLGQKGTRCFMGSLRKEEKKLHLLDERTLNLHHFTLHLSPFFLKHSHILLVMIAEAREVKWKSIWSLEVQN